MNAEEVDLGGFERFCPYAESNGHAGYEGDELPGFAGTNTYMPFLPPPGCFQCPESVGQPLTELLI